MADAKAAGGSRTRAELRIANGRLVVENGRLRERVRELAARCERYEAALRSLHDGTRDYTKRGLGETLPVEYEMPPSTAKRMRRLIEVALEPRPYEDLGDLSAVEPPYRRAMQCDACRVRWYGCADAYECPRCGRGGLPAPEPRRDSAAPSEDVARMVHAFGDKGRKDAVRALAKRVATVEAERDAAIARAEKAERERDEAQALARSDTGELWVDECERARKERDEALAALAEAERRGEVAALRRVAALFAGTPVEATIRAEAERLEKGST